MRAQPAALVLMLGMAACATPGQVRRVETAVATSNSDRARSDSAIRSELARIQIMQRQTVDSMFSLYRQLSDATARAGRETASGFEDIRQRLYQVATLANNTAAGLNRLNSSVQTGLANSAPAAATPDSTRLPSSSLVPSAEVLVRQAQDYINTSAYPTARRSLNLVLTTYPQDPKVPDALYFLGYSFETESVDSARVYYNRVWKGYPKADKAPTALYKLGNLELKAGNVPAARAAWQVIVRDYKDSVEVDRAQALLREHP